MTEQTTETTTEQSTETTEQKTYDREYVDNVRKGLSSQVTEARTELETLRSQLAEREAADASAKEAQLKEQNEFKTLYEAQQEETATLKATFEAERTALQTAQNQLVQDNALIAAGVKDPVQIAGLKAIYSGTADAPDFAEWLTTQNVAVEKGRPSGAVGSVAQGAAGEVRVPMTHDEAKGMTREQKAAARRVILERGRGRV